MKIDFYLIFKEQNSCVDKNECILISNVCPGSSTLNTTCINLIGGYSCACPSGYYNSSEF